MAITLASGLLLQEQTTIARHLPALGHKLAAVSKIREGSSHPINLNILMIHGVTSSAVKRFRRRVKNPTTILNPFKHAPTIDISTWYKGILSTQLATDENTGGAFDLVLAHMKSGTEPPPHLHTREHELLYVLEGTLDAYVDGEVFQVEAGECVFLPLGRPHAFIIRSPEIRMLTLITPGGFMRVVAPMAAPAEKLEISLDSVTYATADLAETMKIFMKHGLRFLSPEEITRQMPAFRYAQRRSPQAARGDAVACSTISRQRSIKSRPPTRPDISPARLRTTVDEHYGR